MAIMPYSQRTAVQAYVVPLCAMVLHGLALAC